MWEVFDARDGRVLVTVRHRWIAALICELYDHCSSRPVDYARPGDGF